MLYQLSYASKASEEAMPSNRTVAVEDDFAGELRDGAPVNRLWRAVNSARMYTAIFAEIRLFFAGRGVLARALDGARGGSRRPWQARAVGRRSGA